MILSGERKLVGSSLRKLFYFYYLFQVFVELDKLYQGEKYDFEWPEISCWIKFEEIILFLLTVSGFCRIRRAVPWRKV